MNLHHELFLHTFGLDRVEILPPAAVATMTCAINGAPAPAPTLEDFIRATERIKDQMAELGEPALPPMPPMKLTRAEFERLKELCEPHLRAARPGEILEGVSRFGGVEIVLVDDVPAPTVPTVSCGKP